MSVDEGFWFEVSMHLHGRMKAGIFSSALVLDGFVFKFKNFNV
jgi:hypothetical protein